MRTLATLQTLTRRTARDPDVVLTSDVNATEPGLTLANKAYRSLAAMTGFEDFTRVNTDHITVADTSDYAGILFDPKYLDITSVEMQDPEDLNGYKRLLPETSELRWSMVSREDPGMPRVYRWTSNALGQPLFTVRPAPDTASLTFRFTGIIEPPPFVDGDSTTLFKGDILDDVLADWIAVHILNERTFTVRANVVLSSISNRLRAVVGREITPDELRDRAA